MRPKEVFQQARLAEETGNSREACEHYASVARFLLKSGKYAESRVVWERAIKLNPDSARLQLGLAASSARMKDEEAARAAVGQFTDLVIRKKQGALYRERMEKDLAKFPELRQLYYEKVLETDRTDPESFIGLARAWMAQEKWEKAQRVLLDALKAKGSADTVLPILRTALEERHLRDGVPHLDRFAQGEISLADLVLLLQSPVKETRLKPLAEEKTLSKLIQDLEEEIGIDLEEKPDQIEPLLREFRVKSEPVLSSDPKARLDMAMAFREMGLSNAAIEEVRKIGETAKCYYEAQCLLGEIYLSQGSLLAALEVYQLCRRGRDVSSEIRHEALYQLVMIYFQLGDHRQASQVARELEKLSPEYRDLKHWKTLLRERQERN